MQAAKVVQEATEETPESEEEDWEAAAESWEDMDAVPAIGPAAEEAKRKVITTCHVKRQAGGCTTTLFVFA